MDLRINPIFHIGPIPIHWYGIILAASILLAYFVIRKNSWKFGIAKEGVDDFSFWLIIFSVLGARIYYVLFSWSYFSAHLNEIFQIWKGGISIFGAVITGLVFSYFYSKKKAFSFWQLTDL